MFLSRMFFCRMVAPLRSYYFTQTIRLTLGIGGSGDIDNMNQSIGVSQIIQKPISQTLALVCARYQSSNIEQFDRDTSGATDTSTVIGSTSLGQRFVSYIRDAGARTGALYLQISYGTVRIDGGETRLK